VQGQLASAAAWTAPGGTLGQILSDVARTIPPLRSRMAALTTSPLGGARPSFHDALARGATVGVIAEVKRRSPSRGALAPAALDAGARARSYETAGAAALSILTEHEHFGGSIDDLSAARAATGLPLLRKDFIIDEAQLLEARAAGASAVLLIVRALPHSLLLGLARRASELGLEPLVEVRTEAELAAALETSAPLIGVNSRDLETLEVRPEVVVRLLPLIPPDRIAVAESGIATSEDVARVAAAGADAVLVGSSLSLAPDPATLLAALSAVPRRPRG
jgi:indole-3-glycerol phosphate synthase